MTDTFLFDLDGTLLDTSEFILAAAEHSLKEHGYDVPNREKISNSVGKRFDDFYFDLSGEKNNKHLQDTHRAFQRENFHLASVFPKVLDTLRELQKKDIKMAVVTTRAKTVNQTIEDAGLSEFFQAVITGEDTKNLKPDPEPLFLAMQRLGAEPHQCVMIGDSYLDIEAGKNAGTKTVRVTSGFHDNRLHDPEPDFVINEISELLNLGLFQS